MRFGLKKMLIAFTVVALLMFVASIPLMHRQRMIANGVRYANESWPTHAVVYDWPPRTDSSTGIQITRHVDRESGLIIQNRSESEFRDAYNGEINRLLSANGPPDYSLSDILPAKTEIHRMFTSAKMNIAGQFPHQLTESIRLDFDGALHIETTGTEFMKGASMCIDYNLPVHVHQTESLIYVKLGGEWMGVFLHDGRPLFEVY